MRHLKVECDDDVMYWMLLKDKYVYGLECGIIKSAWKIRSIDNISSVSCSCKALYLQYKKEEALHHIVSCIWIEWSVDWGLNSEFVIEFLVKYWKIDFEHLYLYWMRKIAEKGSEFKTKWEFYWWNLF